MTFDPQHCSVTVALPAACNVGYPSLPTQHREVEEFMYSVPQQAKPKDRKHPSHYWIGERKVGIVPQKEMRFNKTPSTAHLQPTKDKNEY